MRCNVPRHVLGLAVAALAIGAGGCGLGQHDVTGKVTYNGDPFAKSDGVIVFVGPQGTQVPAAIGADGTYRATRVSGGLNRIAVYYPNPNAKKGKGAKLKPGEPPPPTQPPFLTPPKYADPDTSGLSVTVRSGTVFDADLTGPKIP